VSRSSARREFGGVLAGAALAGGLALSAGGQTWASVTAVRHAPLPPVTVAVLGSDAAPLVPAAGLVLLAAVVALLAVRGLGRVAVGLLMALAGGVLAWSGLRVQSGGLASAAAAAPGLGGPRDTAVTVNLAYVWPALALLAGALGVAAGLAAVLRGRGWPGMGRRYERDTGAVPPPRTDEDRAQAAWQALDRGEDPTGTPEDSAPSPRRPTR
jgi:uncharacterized membrane protein (TIGR02234 family)